ncbi:hypothetical protein [Geminisphaera colitermitum]|uniref:hypothetical protein n=1 Tax=Geminisphaera colitermitum TaxID=1148786 RepID=UPI000158D36B|nr:hypothetical protein [Geminisphaera colitermitum]
MSEPANQAFVASCEAVFWEHYGQYRDSGFDPKKAAEMARLEVSFFKSTTRRFPKAVKNEATRKEIEGRLPDPDWHLVFDAENGKIRYISDADDSTPVASLYDPKKALELARVKRAEAQYLADCMAETGKRDEFDVWLKRKAAKEEMHRQSHSIANKMECAGFKAYRDDNYQLCFWYIHSQTMEKIPAFRRLCFIPCMAAQIRAQKLAALEYFIQCHPFCRFWTFTSGNRVGIDGLSKRLSDLHKRISEFNKKLREKWGIEIVFRSDEFGTLEFDDKLAKKADSEAGRIEFDENGEPLFHVHTHCVVHSLVGYIPPKKWEEVLKWVWKEWGNIWDEGGIIRDAREVCKYVTKPNDMEQLTGEQLVRICGQLEHQRLVVPLGTLRDEIRARKDAQKTLRRKKTHDGVIWTVVDDHNAHTRKDAEAREAEALAFQLRRVETMDRIDAKTGWGIADGKPVRKKDGPVLHVLARARPSSTGPTPKKEPRVVVGWTGAFDRQRVMSHPLVYNLWAETVEMWHSEGAAPAGGPIRVHTDTIAGSEAREMTFMDDVPVRFEPPGPPIWERSAPYNTLCEV